MVHETDKKYNVDIKIVEEKEIQDAKKALKDYYQEYENPGCKKDLKIGDQVLYANPEPLGKSLRLKWDIDGIVTVGVLNQSN